VAQAASVAVYDSSQTWGGPDRGIQLFGSAVRAIGRSAREAHRTYAGRFREFDAEDFADYRFYVLRPRRVKLFDEQALGSGVFVTAKVGAEGRLEWERTEIYHAA
jgi:hypothetical protein